MEYLLIYIAQSGFRTQDRRGVLLLFDRCAPAAVLFCCIACVLLETFVPKSRFCHCIRLIQLRTKLQENEQG